MLGASRNQHGRKPENVSAMPELERDECTDKSTKINLHIATAHENTERW